MRSKKAIVNTLSSFANQIVTIICTLIVPRMILQYFGSSYNGITASISQFLSCASLMIAGVGGITRASLYKPLAEDNVDSISAIVNATDRFMRKIALILALGILLFAGLYPMLVSYEFDWGFSSTLVLILGISTFMQYYFGITYQILLQADQKQYVISGIHIATTIANTILAGILLKVGFGIHVVKLGSAIVFSFSPIFLNTYVKRHYKINAKVLPDNSALKQRWDAFGQSVAYFIHNNTDVIVLTIFADIKEVSVYTVYNYVISNIRNLIVNFITGFGAAFGSMLAKGEYELAKKNLKAYELIVFSLTAIIYSTAGLMIVPFALLYTKNVTDIEYSRPLFALIATLAGAFSCFRIPYQTIVEAAGHFKQTRNGAILEAVMNIAISIVAVTRFGLVGVAIGTLAATIFRSVQYAVYLSKNIIKRNILIFWGHVLTVCIIACLTYLLSGLMFTFETGNFLLWCVKSFGIVSVSLILTLIVDILLYRETVIYLFHKIRNLLKK